MIDRGQVFVRALTPDGWDSVDALDLDSQSFRRLVLDKIVSLGALYIVKLDDTDVEPEPLRIRR